MFKILLILQQSVPHQISGRPSSYSVSSMRSSSSIDYSKIPATFAHLASIACVQ